MALTFETTHEYYLKDVHMHYCHDHNGLCITQDFEDRIVITGIKPEPMLKFAQEIVTKSLEKEVTPKKKAATK